MTTTPERFTGPFDEQLSSRLLQQRIIVLGQEVDDAVANRLCAVLLLLSAEDPHRDISLYINSPGGLVSAADHVAREHERKDILVDNAGILPEATTPDAEQPLDLDLFTRTFRTNLFGAAAARSICRD